MHYVLIYFMYLHLWKFMYVVEWVLAKSRLHRWKVVSFRGDFSFSINNGVFFTVEVEVEFEWIFLRDSLSSFILSLYSCVSIACLEFDQLDCGEFEVLKIEINSYISLDNQSYFQDKFV